MTFLTTNRPFIGVSRIKVMLNEGKILRYALSINNFGQIPAENVALELVLTFWVWPACLARRDTATKLIPLSDQTNSAGVSAAPWYGTSNHIHTTSP